jgi:hypothetical protein
LFPGRYLNQIPDPPSWRDLERGLEFTPHNSELWKNKGVALLKLKQSDQVLFWFDGFSPIAPQNSDLWHGKAEAQDLGVVRRHWPAANEPSLAPRDNNPWNKTGILLRAGGSMQEAGACFHQARDLGGK